MARSLRGNTQKPRFDWPFITLASLSLAVLFFLLWELVQHEFFYTTDPATLHVLFITRGIAIAVVLALWAAWYVHRSRERLLEALAESEERYRTIVELAQDAIVLYDPEGRVVDWNKRAEEIYGYPREEVLGRFPPYIETPEEFRKMLQAVASGQVIRRRHEKRRDRSGRIREVVVALAPQAAEPNGKVQILEIAHDMTEFLEIQRQISHMDKMATLGQLVSGIAHQLNTPLASILLLTQMMEEECEGAPAEFQENLRKIEKQVKFCKQTVQRLLSLARPSVSTRSWVDLRSIVEDLFVIYDKEFRKRGIRPRLVCECEEAEVYADPNEMEQALLNLIHNALDAMPEGGELTVRFRSDDWYVTVEVEDTGVGMDSEVQKRIFEPFFTTKGYGKGTGLGLAIVKRIVEDHNGEIRVKSEKKKGTTFILRLPREANENAETRADR